MALVHSPRRTRNQAAAGAAEVPAVPAAAAAAVTTESETLRAILLELEQLREERRRERDALRRKEQELSDLARRREEDVRRLEERLRDVSGESVSYRSSARAGELSAVKIKPDVYDGGVPWREFLAQFELVARANGWGDLAKATVLATSLRGKARSVLEGLEEGFSYEEIRSKLESRFGDRGLFQSCYAQFTNRKQGNGEDLATLGADLERLSRLAYPECSHEIREKVACAQFIAALSDGFVKRTLQLENVTSLRAAVERAKAVKAIQENSFRAGREAPCGFVKGGERAGAGRSSDFRGYNGGRSGSGAKEERKQRGDGERKEKECWKCGKKGHFRFECPAGLSGNKA